MNINIQTVGFSAKEELIDYVKERTANLQVYYDRIIDVEVYLRLIQDERKETKEVEYKVHIPGNELFAKDHSDKFETAINSTIEKIKGQIRKVKTRQDALRR